MTDPIEFTGNTGPHKVGRPKSSDPTQQMAIYPPKSLRERLYARAEKLGVKPAALAVEMIEQGLDLRERDDG